MSEIEGALGVAQLKRLDRTIGRMRDIRAELDRAVADAGMVLRPHTDPAGEAGTALVFYCDDAAAAEWAVAALRAEGVSATSLLGLPGTNRHWAGDWIPILERCGVEPPAPTVLDSDRNRLAAGVHIGVDPRYTATDVDETRLALEKVLARCP